MPKSMFSKNYQQLTQIMSEVRKEKGLTQVELANALEKPQSFVSKIENGERRIDLIEMIAIADAIGIPAMDILHRLESQIKRPIQL